MNNIILKAFELAGFKNASELYRLVSLTPNPEASAELLLGVYKPMEVNEFGRYFTPHWGDKLLWVESVDRLSQTAVCYELSPDMQKIYFITREDKEQGVCGQWPVDGGDNPSYERYYRNGEIKLEKMTLKFEDIRDRYRALSDDEYSKRYEAMKECQIPRYLTDLAEGWEEPNSKLENIRY